MASLRVSSSTAARPTRWSIRRGGTLPLRKPGIVTCWAIALYALSRLGLSSSKGTSTESRTRVALRVSTVLFTCVLLVVLAIAGRRGDGGFSGGAQVPPQRDPQSVGDWPTDSALRTDPGSSLLPNGA